MKTRKIYVDFQKIINGGYSFEELLLIYQWLINIGRECNEQYGWNRYGLQQSFHGYSYNNEKNEVYKLGVDAKRAIYDGFVRILCRTNLPCVVDKFLCENRIKLGKIRRLKFNEDDSMTNTFYKDLICDRSDNFGDVDSLIRQITTSYKGLELKKELFHEDYPDRKTPRIIGNVSIGTNHNKWYSEFTYSFEKFNYEPGWTYTISQKEYEPLKVYFNRVIEELNSLLVPADSCDNCPLWSKSDYHGNVLRNRFKGTCRHRSEDCGRPNVVRYTSILSGKDNALHDSLVFPYFRLHENTSLDINKLNPVLELIK